MSKTGAAPDPLVGRVINDRFKITGLIARGGMGKVYRAEQAPLGRVCAVKVLNTSYAGDQDPEFHKRFFLEASIASKLTHPNSVTIFDYGRTDDDIYYMAMEYLEGQTLHRAIREAGFFQEERAAHIGRQICRALREAHSLGVIHRDLKPANVFLVGHGDETDFVKVLDFGLVKDVSEGTPSEDLTQTGLFMGSPKYMAPEQIRGDRVDARTDIYSLGIILYEMLAGKVPFDRPNSVNILMAHVHDEPPPLRVTNPAADASPEIEATVAKCLSKSPDDRFRSMDEVLAVLKRVASSQMGVTVGTTGEYRALGMSGVYGDSGPMRIDTGVHTSIPAAPRRTSSGAAPLDPSRVPVGTSNPPPLPSSSIPGSRAPLSQVPSFSAPLPPVPSGGNFVPSPLSSGHGTVPLLLTTPASSQPPPKGRKYGVLLGGGLAVLALGAAVLLANVKPLTGEASSATTAGGTAAVPATPPSAEPSAPPVPVLVKVRLVSDPSDASVKEEGAEVCAATPCEVSYRGADADADREHHLTFSKSGFKPESRVLKVGDGPLMVRMTRVPATSTWSAPAAASPRPEPKPSDDAKSDSLRGFKDLPY